jgi:hypothetical protein
MNPGEEAHGNQLQGTVMGRGPERQAVLIHAANPRVLLRRVGFPIGT